MKNLAILVGGKGRGSNMANLVAACREGRVDAIPTLVIGTREESPALALARELGVATRAISPKDENYAELLSEALRDADILCLAGFMNLLPLRFLRPFSGPILNIHPALLPKFGGKGMYGHHVHEAVIASGERVSGCTVHHVTEHYDEGEIVLQAELPILPGETPESLAAKVLKLEHETYPRAVSLVIKEHPL
jgi:phosphoribosylglycinamide formyltransferase 1